ncbi:MAG: CvpA family protein [Armatimonadetes bacterium]|nr:CvpA family protein [Armatimonadota bacterium]
MVFNWVDIVILCLFALIVALEARRGFGRALIDAIGFFGVLKITTLMYPALSRSISLSSDPNTNQAACFAILFVMGSAVVLYIGKLLYGYSLITLEVFDPILGFVLGLVIATIVSHLFVRFLLIALTSQHVGPDILARSALGEELLGFDSYHRVLNALYNLGE